MTGQSESSMVVGRDIGRNQAATGMDQDAAETSSDVGQEIQHQLQKCKLCDYYCRSAADGHQIRGHQTHESVKWQVLRLLRMLKPSDVVNTF